eukprot:8134035-Heterocapsa_arctica.AAC.1
MSTGAVAECFSPYGEIRSLGLFRLEDGRSRGMGVCTFVTSEEAGEALRGGIVIEGNPVFMQEDVSQYKD